MPRRKQPMRRRTEMTTRVKTKKWAILAASAKASDLTCIGLHPRSWHRPLGRPSLILWLTSPNSLHELAHISLTPLRRPTHYPIFSQYCLPLLLACLWLGSHSSRVVLNFRMMITVVLWNYNSKYIRIAQLESWDGIGNTKSSTFFCISEAV